GRELREDPLFLWLETPELAIARVARLVQLDGHSVPDEVIRRRYAAGLRNFFGLYRPLMSTWQVFDNSHLPGPRIIARGDRGCSVGCVGEPCATTGVSAELNGSASRAQMASTDQAIGN